MNCKEFKKRKLDKCYMVVYIIRKNVKIKNKDIIEDTDLYALIGITPLGFRTVIGLYLNLTDSRSWIEVLEDIKGRGCEDIFYLCFEGDNKFKRALNLLFPETINLPSIFDVILTINKFFDSSFKNPLPKQIKGLFLSENKEEFNINYELLLECYKEDYLVRIVMEKHLENIVSLCDLDIGLRRVLFNYYFLRDFYYYFNKLNDFNYEFDIDDIINSLLNEIIHLEKFKSSTKIEIRNNLNVLNELFGERLLRYL